MADSRFAEHLATFAGDPARGVPVADPKTLTGIYRLGVPRMNDSGDYPKSAALPDPSCPARRGRVGATVETCRFGQPSGFRRRLDP